jgi:hypothetical protein
MKESTMLRHSDFSTRWLGRLLLLGYLLLPGSCGSDGSGGGGGGGSQTTSIEKIYARATTTLAIEVDYQTGAEPYTGTLLTMDTWNIFGVNANALFKNQKTLQVPTTLAAMQALSDITATTFTSQQVLDIATKHRDQADTADRATFYIVFLNGLFHDGQMVRNDVLGVSIGATRVIAMFKPVIASSASLPNVRKFVEQSTLVHEFGHAVGLVNNGVAMVNAHQDPAHGAHDTSSACVMYYANEGASDAAQFAQRYITTCTEVIFDSACLADTAARIAAAK